MSDFVSLGVPQELSDVLAGLQITSPTPIQEATLPDSLAGRDVLGRGRTGSGKTYAFLLPLVARLMATPKRRVAKKPRALVLAPTRELVTQIEESLKPLETKAGLTSMTIFGGVNQKPQVRQAAAGIDIVLACPGRLLDLMGQGALDLSAVEITILDEADHMADMGFLPMVKRILDKTPSNGQKMLFSATLDNGIDVLVKRYLHQPVTHEAEAIEAPAQMDHHVLQVAGDDKVAVLADLASAPGKAILFTRTKHGAKKLAKQLIARGVPAVDLHGNLAQNARTRNMDAFHSGRVETLVATDIAARGIHVDDVELVIHADPPAEHKAYLHRSGRTARAGKAGTVVTVITAGQQAEVRQLMKAAKIHPTLDKADPATLQELAPGERVHMSADQAQEIAYPGKPLVSAQPSGQQGRQGSRGPRNGSPKAQQSSASRRPRNAGTKQPTRAATSTNKPTTRASASNSESRTTAASFSASNRRGRSR